MLKCVIFDIDGVLVSTDEYHYAAWKKIAEDLMIPFDRQNNMSLRGVSRMESLEIILRKSERIFTMEEKQDLAAKKNDLYVGMLHEMLDEKCILKGVKESLAYLRARGICIAVASSSCNGPYILQKLELDCFIDVMVSGLDIRYSKPHPEVFLTARKRAGFMPDECLIVEDAKTGVEAGVSANIRVLGVGPASENPDAVFRAKSLENFNWDYVIKYFGVNV